MRKLAALVLIAVSAPALAHPLAPGMLELQQTSADQYAVTWRTTVARANGGMVEPRLPDSCQPTVAASSRVEDGAQVMRWAVACEGPLEGKTISVDRLEGSGINVILRVAPVEGRAFETLLGADQPAAVVRFDGAGTFSRYFALGIGHLLTGADHLLFLLGLFFLVPGVRRLVATVTAFTVGHSLTLALATIGYVPLRQEYAEILIACTVLALALALARGPVVAGPLHRQPWLMAGAFGLVHGLGFAGALREAGLPAGEIPAALLAFNLGIEAAQLGVVAALLACATLNKKLGSVSEGNVPLVRLTPAYVIGSMAACWVLERSAALLTSLA